MLIQEQTLCQLQQPPAVPLDWLPAMVLVHLGQERRENLGWQLQGKRKSHYRHNQKTSLLHLKQKQGVLNTEMYINNLPPPLAASPESTEWLRRAGDSQVTSGFRGESCQQATVMEGPFLRGIANDVL